MSKVAVIIPALNEEQSIGQVIRSIPEPYSSEVIVVDNGSTDRTAEIAAASGAKVIAEPKRGYGLACLRGIGEIRDAEIVVFLDADFSDHPQEMTLLVDPIEQGRADMVIGSRVLGKHEEGALLPHAEFGNRLAGSLIWLLYHHRYSDLGPFRAIRYSALQAINMQDRTFGWTVEMQVKAVKQGLRIQEVPVSYRKRIGTSKISGTIAGSVKAGTKIIWTILKCAVV